MVRGKEGGDYPLCSQPQCITSLTFFVDNSSVLSFRV
jgi:hypothetical protein